MGRFSFFKLYFLIHSEEDSQTYILDFLLCLVDLPIFIAKGNF